jgi:flagellin
MTAVLNTNMASLYAQQNLSTAQSDLATSVQRLSSGKRINSAADDAAGFAISQAITATKNITDQSIQNTQDAVSMVQTASGALDVVGKILQRALTLTTEKADGSLTPSQTTSINDELTSLFNEVAQIKARTKFQGGNASLFGQSFSFQTGDGSSTSISIADLSLGSLAGSSLASVNAAGTAATSALTSSSPAGAFYGATIQVADSTGALAAATAGNLMVSVNGLPSATVTVSSILAQDNGLDKVTLSGNVTAGATYSFTNVIGKPVMGTDLTPTVDGTASVGAQFTILNSSALTANLQVGQRVYDLTAGTDNGLSIASIVTGSSSTTITLTPGALAITGTGANKTDTLAIGNSLNSNSSTADIMDAVQVNSANQASLGTWSNRLNYIIDNMQTLSNNTADALSRIVDTNYAAETANLTRGQILQQAATSMLAQANQMPNVILTLLK